MFDDVSVIRETCALFSSCAIRCPAISLIRRHRGNRPMRVGAITGKKGLVLCKVIAARNGTSVLPCMRHMIVWTLPHTFIIKPAFVCRKRENNVTQIRCYNGVAVVIFI